jgi:hypothetical protein
VPLLDQELFTLTEYISLFPAFNVIRDAQSLVRPKCFVIIFQSMMVFPTTAIVCQKACK